MGDIRILILEHNLLILNKTNALNPNNKYNQYTYTLFKYKLQSLISI